MTSNSPAAPIAFLDLAALHAPLREDLDKLWFEVVRDSAFIGGERVAQFESDWAHYVGATHAIGVANGTDALELVMAGLDIGPGDEVILPANTFVATAEAVVTCGARPVFVDVDQGSLLVTADHIEPAITERTRAVIVVHLYGAIPHMAPIQALCEAHDMHLIEDAAQAHGATHHGQSAGTFGIAGTFSFYPGKNLGALGDGGAIVTGDDGLAEKMRVLANHGRGHHHLHVESGRNSRLDGLQAGALALKLQHLDHWNDSRRTVNGMYRSLFAGRAVSMLEVPEGTTAVHHLEVVRVEDRSKVQAALDAASIGWGVHYAAPCHRQPAFEQYAPSYDMPVVEQAAAQQLSLPMHPTLTAPEVERVASVVIDAVERD
ncbi:MAG: DegT/DnrJ/EryC1/StrS family aminotransferase [Actinomycetota bacterium]